MFLNWALLVPKLRSLEFPLEAKQREPFGGLQKPERAFCTNWLWC